MDPENIVRDFCSAIEGRDIAKLSGFFSDDAVYHNMPIAPVRGREAIASTLGQFLGPATSEAEFEILALAVVGRRVLTERVDRFTIGDKKVELPVMGAFEVGDDGKITAWRDYFDMNQFSSQLS
jgi:limonene-1,2-epoxide hydrolase